MQSAASYRAGEEAIKGYRAARAAPVRLSGRLRDEVAAGNHAVRFAGNVGMTPCEAPGFAYNFANDE